MTKILIITISFIAILGAAFWYLQTTTPYYHRASYVFPEGSGVEEFHGKSVKLLLGNCSTRTKDNEGCAFDAWLWNNADGIIANGHWWVVKAYGKRQIRVEWRNFDDPYFGSESFFSTDELTLGF